jgi:Ca-activated chloride channel homolog
MTTKRYISKTVCLAALSLTLPVVNAGHQAPTPVQDPSAGSFRIAVDVPLVVLHATVTDRQGSLVGNLREQDFQIYENGVAQRIQLFKNEDVPVAVGLVIDHSTSMGPKLVEVTAAARAFVRSSNREDQIFVVNFNEIASLGLPRSIRFTDSTAELEYAISGQSARGQTALYDAIAKALEQLETASWEKKALIVVSDGGDNASRRKLDEVMKLAERSSAVIYTIGVFDQSDEDRNPGVLNHLARATGGEAFLPGQLDDVVANCERIARDIRHQYIIGYTPSNPAPDGSYRSIRAVVRTKGQGRLSVRTRTGYIAGGEPGLGGGQGVR